MNEYAALKRQQQDVAERLEEIRNEFLWSQRGLIWFEGFMECASSVDIAKPLHELLRGVDTTANIQRIKRKVEEFVEDAEEPWMRERAEEIVVEQNREAA